MIHYLKLTPETLTEFQDIHHKIMPKRTRWFQSQGVVESTSKYANTDKSMYETTEPIRKKMMTLLEQVIHVDPGLAGYDISNYYLEFHQRNCSDYNNKNKSWFDWHTDDNGAVSYKVYSIIFYLRKDITVRGGDFDYMVDGIKTTHQVNAGDCLIFRGDLNHCPQPSWGFGCRDAIVCFVKRN